MFSQIIFDSNLQPLRPQGRAPPGLAIVLMRAAPTAAAMRALTPGPRTAAVAFTVRAPTTPAPWVALVPQGRPAEVRREAWGRLPGRLCRRGLRPGQGRPPGSPGKEGRPHRRGEIGWGYIA